MAKNVSSSPDNNIQYDKGHIQQVLDTTIIEHIKLHPEIYKNNLKHDQEYAAKKTIIFLRINELLNKFLVSIDQRKKTDDYASTRWRTLVDNAVRAKKLVDKNMKLTKHLEFCYKNLEFVLQAKANTKGVKIVKAPGTDVEIARKRSASESCNHDNTSLPIPPQKKNCASQSRNCQNDMTECADGNDVHTEQPLGNPVDIENSFREEVNSIFTLAGTSGNTCQNQPVDIMNLFRKEVNSTFIIPKPFEKNQGHAKSYGATQIQPFQKSSDTEVLFKKKENNTSTPEKVSTERVYVSEESNDVIPEKDMDNINHLIDNVEKNF